MAVVPPNQDPVEKKVYNGQCSDTHYDCANHPPYPKSWWHHDWPHGVAETDPYDTCTVTCSHEHSPSSSGCHGYNTESTSLYSCPNHRYYDANKNNPLSEPPDNNVIFNNYLNHLHNILNNEIDARNAHTMYNQARDNTTVNQKDILSANQPNNLEKSIESLRSTIAKYEDKKYNSTIQNIYLDVYRSNIIKKNEIYKLYTEINNKWSDCICHNDCTSFGCIKTYSQKCTCNGNCGCDYGFNFSRY